MDKLISFKVGMKVKIVFFSQIVIIVYPIEMVLKLEKNRVVYDFVLCRNLVLCGL